MKIEIWSDIICPFCYVGKKHLELALEKLPFKDDIDIVWRSFMLDPNLPIQGLNKTKEAYLIEDKGFSKEQVQGMLGQLERAGEAVGITFNHQTMIPVNTLYAHRLSHFAQQRGLGNEIEEALFYAHFTQGKNLGDTSELVNLAVSIGLDQEEVHAFLNSNSATQEVQADIEKAKSLGISGVPFFVLDEKYGVSGAQPVDVFIQGITQAYTESNDILNQDQMGSSCTIDGCD